MNRIDKARLRRNIKTVDKSEKKSSDDTSSSTTTKTSVSSVKKTTVITPSRSRSFQESRSRPVIVRRSSVIPKSVKTETTKDSAVTTNSTRAAKASIVAQGLAYVPPLGSSTVVDGRKVSTDIFSGTEIKYAVNPDTGNFDQLAEIEKLPLHEQLFRGGLSATAAQLQPIKDVATGVKIEDMRAPETAFDLVLNPILTPFAEKEGWYNPLDPVIQHFNLTDNAPEKRDFATGVQKNFELIGQTLFEDDFGGRVSEGFATSGEKFSRAPVYWVASAVGEIPYWLIGVGEARAIASVGVRGAILATKAGSMPSAKMLMLAYKADKGVKNVQRAVNLETKLLVDNAKISDMSKLANNMNKQSVKEAVKIVSDDYTRVIGEKKKVLKKLKQNKNVKEDNEVVVELEKSITEFESQRDNFNSKYGRLANSDQSELNRIANLEFLRDEVLPKLRTTKSVRENFVKQKQTDYVNTLKTQRNELQNELNELKNPASSILTDSAGRVMTDSSGRPITRYAGTISDENISRIESIEKQIRSLDDKIIAGKLPIEALRSEIELTPSKIENILTRRLKKRGSTLGSEGDATSKAIMAEVSERVDRGYYDGPMGSFRFIKDMYGGSIGAAARVRSAKVQSLSEYLSIFVPTSKITKGEDIQKAIKQLEKRKDELNSERKTRPFEVNGVRTKEGKEFDSISNILDNQLAQFTSLKIKANQPAPFDKLVVNLDDWRRVYAENGLEDVFDKTLRPKIIVSAERSAVNLEQYGDVIVGDIGGVDGMTTVTRPVPYDIAKETLGGEAANYAYKKFSGFKLQRGKRKPTFKKYVDVTTIYKADDVIQEKGRGEGLVLLPKGLTEQELRAFKSTLLIEEYTGDTSLLQNMYKGKDIYQYKKLPSFSSQKGQTIEEYYATKTKIGDRDITIGEVLKNRDIMENRITLDDVNQKRQTLTGELENIDKAIDSGESFTPSKIEYSVRDAQELQSLDNTIMNNSKKIDDNEEYVGGMRSSLDAADRKNFEAEVQSYTQYLNRGEKSTMKEPVIDNIARIVAVKIKESNELTNANMIAERKQKTIRKFYEEQNENVVKKQQDQITLQQYRKFIKSKLTGIEQEQVDIANVVSLMKEVGATPGIPRGTIVEFYTGQMKSSVDNILTGIKFRTTNPIIKDNKTGKRYYKFRASNNPGKSADRWYEIIDPNLRPSDIESTVKTVTSFPTKLWTPTSDKLYNVRALSQNPDIIQLNADRVLDNTVDLPSNKFRKLTETEAVEIETDSYLSRVMQFGKDIVEEQRVGSRVTSFDEQTGRVVNEKPVITSTDPVKSPIYDIAETTGIKRDLFFTNYIGKPIVRATKNILETRRKLQGVKESIFGKRFTFEVSDSLAEDPFAQSSTLQKRIQEADPTATQITNIFDAESLKSKGIVFTGFDITNSYSWGGNLRRILASRDQYVGGEVVKIDKPKDLLSPTEGTVGGVFMDISGQIPEGVRVRPMYEFDTTYRLLPDEPAGSITSDFELQRYDRATKQTLYDQVQRKMARKGTDGGEKFRIQIINSYYNNILREDISQASAKKIASDDGMFSRIETDIIQNNRFRDTTPNERRAFNKELGKTKLSKDEYAKKINQRYGLISPVSGEFKNIVIGRNISSTLSNTRKLIKTKTVFSFLKNTDQTGSVTKRTPQVGMQTSIIEDPTTNRFSTLFSKINRFRQIGIEEADPIAMEAYVLALKRLQSKGVDLKKSDIDQYNRVAGKGRFSTDDALLRTQTNNNDVDFIPDDMKAFYVKGLTSDQEKSFGIRNDQLITKNDVERIYGADPNYMEAVTDVKMSELRDTSAVKVRVGIQKSKIDSLKSMVKKYRELEQIPNDVKTREQLQLQEGLRFQLVNEYGPRTTFRTERIDGNDVIINPSVPEVITSPLIPDTSVALPKLPKSGVERLTKDQKVEMIFNILADDYGVPLDSRYGGSSQAVSTVKKLRRDIETLKNLNKQLFETTDPTKAQNIGKQIIDVDERLQASTAELSNLGVSLSPVSKSSASLFPPEGRRVQAPTRGIAEAAMRYGMGSQTSTFSGKSAPGILGLALPATSLALPGQNETLFGDKAEFGLPSLGLQPAYGETMAQPGVLNVSLPKIDLSPTTTLNTQTAIKSSTLQLNPTSVATSLATFLTNSKAQIQNPLIAQLPKLESVTSQRDKLVPAELTRLITDLGTTTSQITTQRLVLGSPPAYPTTMKFDFRITPPKRPRYDYSSGRVKPPTVIFPLPFRDILENELEARERAKKKKSKKTYWQTPQWWYQPYYWGGKDQLGSGYTVFTGKEPGKVRKYEKKYFGYEQSFFDG